MSEPILPQPHSPEKSNDDNYRNPYEALCAKLHQMKNIANITIRSKEIKEQELFDVLCSLADMLTETSHLCDNLTPRDIPTYEKTRIV